MRSIRDVVREEGLTQTPVSLRALATQYSVTSLAALVIAHDERQRALEVLKFHQVIETPSGTPLGGWVDLEVHGNGTYQVTFHMHSSSMFGDFDFDLRGYLTAPGCPVFFFHHSGHVSGVDDANYPEAGTSPLIALCWPQLQSSGSFVAAKDYQWGGVVGTLDRLATDLVNLRILDFASGVAGATLGVIIGVTREAVGWLNLNLGPGGTIGVLGGVAVFAAAAALGASTAAAAIFGTVAGVQLGGLTDALISYRAIGQEEIDRAAQVFGTTIPYDKVVLTNLAGLSGRAFTAPGIDGRIYCNLGDSYDSTLGPHRPGYPAAGELLIHELTHAWQIAHGNFLPGFVCSGIVNQTDYVFGDNVYAYGPAGPGWSAFNLEQQGAIVDQWFAGNLKETSRQSTYEPMDTTVNPYYMYIRDNILG